jgi:hypothetical protein
MTTITELRATTRSAVYNITSGIVTVFWSKVVSELTNMDIKAFTDVVNANGKTTAANAWVMDVSATYLSISLAFAVIYLLGFVQAFRSYRQSKRDGLFMTGKVLGLVSQAVAFFVAPFIYFPLAVGLILSGVMTLRATIAFTRAHFPKQ